MTITAYEKGILDLSLPVAADYSAKQFYLMAQNTSGQIVLASSAGQRVMGVLQDDPDTAGDQGLLRVIGVTKAIAGTTIAWNAEVVTDANGKAAPKTDNNQHVIGTALSSAVASDIFPLLLTGPTAFPSYGRGSVIAIPIHLATIADGDIVTAWTPGFAGTIAKVDFITTVVASTASKLSTLNLEIGTTDVTGGTVALTTAGCDTLGKVVAGAAITAENTFTATDTISVEAASTTTFGEGAGVLMIGIY